MPEQSSSSPCSCLSPGAEYMHTKSFDRGPLTQNLEDTGSTQQSLTPTARESWEVKQHWDHVSSEAAKLRNHVPGPLK
jgi:hypothetical protein